MKNIAKAMRQLSRSMNKQHQRTGIPFEEFIDLMTQKPHSMLRNVFQVFYDMVKTFVGEGFDEYPGDPESINYVFYDCTRLFVEGSDHPFFADRLFANRLITHVEALKRGAQQNKIYIFEGPHGSGKSTFLNNLLRKFEEYANTEDGCRYETIWRLDRKAFGSHPEREGRPVTDKLIRLLDENPALGDLDINHAALALGDRDEFIEIPCPSHDNPILMIPKDFRREFFDDLFRNDEFKWKLFTEKEYEWVFQETPCTICSSIYDALLNRFGGTEEVFKMLHARPYHFKRRLGEGVSVFNPGDRPLKQNVLTNSMLQNRINSYFRDSNQVRYIFSRYAKTNNGIYALMDIKSQNTDRLIELHNIISEGVHKVEDIEENVNSLFFALMNPEDKKNIQDFPSFSDRIEYINIPYVLDLNTEVEIYRNIFGKHIDNGFLPRVLHNFARVIISSRLSKRSEALLEWIGDPYKYRQFCDDNLQLLKMEIYTGHIPPWLTEDDRKRFNAKRRLKIIAESENEGREGFSGRDSIKIFNDFYSSYAKEGKMINMGMLYGFFTRARRELSDSVPAGFLESLLHMYNYTILHEVKESLYYYNEEQIGRDIQNYLFAINFEIGSFEKCRFTGDKLEITEEFLENIERRILGASADKNMFRYFRKDTQKEYTSETLPQEIMFEGKKVADTKLYKSLHERYVYNLKEKVLDPFLENENFRRAVNDYGLEEFKTYDQKIREDVGYLLKNLIEKFGYTRQGAKEICMYVIDNDLAKRFSK